MLFEYRQGNRVKEHRSVKYIIDMKTLRGEKKLVGYNYSDRIVLTKASSLILHQNLMSNKLSSFLSESLMYMIA